MKSYHGKLAISRQPILVMHRSKIGQIDKGQKLILEGHSLNKRLTYMYVYADGVHRLELDQGAEKSRAAFYDSFVKTRESNAYRPQELAEDTITTRSLGPWA